jgi:hypothetical protein
MCHGYYRAKPYVDAMSRLDSIHSMYGADTAKSVVLYFLANANTWRGEDARRIKNELRAMCGMAPTVEKRKKEKV